MPSRLLPPPMTYRHVVFPDSCEGGGRPVNFSEGALDHGPAYPPLAPASGPELSSDESACLRWLFEQAGLDLNDYRPETIKRRMPACLRALRVGSPAQVRVAIQRQPNLLKSAISALVIGVTCFFRDPPVFAALAESVLPEMTSRSAGPRVWSVGCSDGAELYSVAMLLAERGALQRTTLLGTDCRPDAIARARDGRYDPGAVRHVPADVLHRYLTFDRASWQVHPFLRTIAQWRSGNAMTTSEPGAWDLVLCRNLAIYMQPAATHRLWARLEQSLRLGGVLVLGKAERPTGATRLTLVAPGIYRRDRC